MKKTTDPLAEPWAKKITAEVAALKKKEIGNNRQINRVRAGIGDRCRTMKEKLKHGEFGAWAESHVTRDSRRLSEYMRLAELRSSNPRTFGDFEGFDPCKMTRIAAVPAHLIDTLTPDLVLPVPPKNLMLPLWEMGYHKLDAALDLYEGKKGSTNATERRITACVSELRDLALKDPGKFAAQLPALQALAGCPTDGVPASKEARVRESIGKAKALKKLAAAAQLGAGQFPTSLKQEFVDAVDDVRYIGLKWPGTAIPRRRGVIRPGGGP